MSMTQMGSFMHAQGPYKHLMPGSPDFKKGASSVFSATFFSKQFPQKAPLAGGEKKGLGFDGEENEKGLSPLLSSASSPPSWPCFLSPRGANLSVSLSLHHSADRRVR